MMGKHSHSLTSLLTLLTQLIISSVELVSWLNEWNWMIVRLNLAWHFSDSLFSWSLLMINYTAYYSLQLLSKMRHIMSYLCYYFNFQNSVGWKMEKLGTIYNTNRVRITLKVLKSSVPLASPVENRRKFTNEADSSCYQWVSIPKIISSRSSHYWFNWIITCASQRATISKTLHY